MKKLVLLALFTCLIAFSSQSNDLPGRWQQGILSNEFICDNPPFPESHAPTIAEAKEGHLVASWFGGSKEGFKDVCIWVSRFTDGAWSFPEKAIDGVINDTLRYPCYNPVLYQVPGGELQLYYKVGPYVAGWVGKMIYSGDGGITWSAPIDLPEGYLGPVKNKPVLIDGQLIGPSSTEVGGWRVHFELTDDFGKTWRKTEPINDTKLFNIIQPSILTYADGRLQVLCRSQERAIVESWSYDRGETWTTPAAIALPNNNSGTDAETLKDGRQLLVYNHVLPPADADEGRGVRSPLNIALSDDGKTWQAAVVLESDRGEYSYPSVIQSSDGTIHVVYTWKRQKVKHIRLDPDKLALSPMTDGEWPAF